LEETKLRSCKGQDSEKTVESLRMRKTNCVTWYRFSG